MPRRRIELTKVDHLLDELLEDASTPEEILGEQGLLRQLTQRLMERALSAELTITLIYRNTVIGYPTMRRIKRVGCALAQEMLSHSSSRSVNG